MAELEKEIWKDINYLDFGDVYEASTLGNVRRKSTQKIVKPSLRGANYLAISLSKNNIKTTASIHQIIAKTFLENTDNLPVVNHKDGNKVNNHITNLEWCTYKDNTKHSLENNLTKPSRKKVYQLTKDGKIVKLFNSIKEAEQETGINNRLITQVCKHQKKSAHGFIWKYENDSHNIQVFEDQVEGKVIEDYPNYTVTKEGKIYSKKSKKFLIPNPSSDYLYVKLCNKGKQKDFCIHFLVAKAYIQNPNNYPVINHINGDKRDNRLENLEWVTYSQNMIHSVNLKKSML